MARTIRVFIACSLDGFIAGPDDDLSWLPEPVEGQDYGYATHMQDTAALLMGRNTYDVAAKFEPWPYDDTPVFVATNEFLPLVAPTVFGISGDPAELLRAVEYQLGKLAAETEGDAAPAADGVVATGGLYLDGGALIRAFLDVGLVDELTVSVIPVILGEGTPLFAGVSSRRTLELQDVEQFDDGLVQLRYLVRHRLEDRGD
jgi:dihydrofolate reductase